MDVQLQLYLPQPQSTRDARLNQIVKFVHSHQGVTVGQVANALGLRKTPYLRAMLNQVVCAGFASVREIQTGRPLPTYVYDAEMPDSEQP